MINYVAVLVAAVASMVIGFLWYSPALFGKKWLKLMKIKAKDIKKMQKGAKEGYIVAFISALVTAYVLAYFLGLLDIKTAVEGAKVGFWAWLGFIATTQIGSVLWEGKPKELFVLNTAHALIGLVVMGAILAAM